MARIRRLFFVGLTVMVIVGLGALPAVAKSSSNNAGGGNVRCSVYELDELKLDDAPSFVGQVVHNSDVSVRITYIKWKGSEAVAFRYTQVSGDPIQRVHVKASTKTKMYLTPWAANNVLWSPTKGELGSRTKHHEISNIRWCY